MTTLYLIEFAAYKQIKKIVDFKNGRTLNILFVLWDDADDKLRIELPSFARLLCKITPDPYLWDHKIKKFKIKFLQSYPIDLTKILTENQLEFFKEE